MMRSGLFAGVGLVVMCCSSSLWAGEAPEAAKPAYEREAPFTHQWGMLDTYCSKCHNFTDWAGEVAFDTMSPDGVPDNVRIWETVLRKLRGHLMPPPGNPQPEEGEVDAFRSTLAAYLDEVAAAEPHPGYVGAHRLNRKQYANEVKEILGLTVDPAAILPQEAMTDGFDNAADVLTISPTFLNQYVKAARDISILAVGDPKPLPERAVYEAPRGKQSEHLEGLPLGTRGGMLVEHFFPADGDYTFNISVPARGGLEYRNTFIMTIDGEKVFSTEIGGPEDDRAVLQKQKPASQAIADRFQNIRLHVGAGPHKVGMTFIDRATAKTSDRLQPFDPASANLSGPQVRGLVILGPDDPSGVGDTPSRQKIFICRPADDSEKPACAKTIVSNLARKAYRRPLSETDLKPLMGFYEAGEKAGGFEKGIQQAVMAILASPKFLYQSIPAKHDLKPGQVYRISDLALASRLSFFLWNQGPDDALLDLAAKGELHDPGVLDGQIDRMLKDPRSSSLVTDFAFQWLNVAGIYGVNPDPNIFPAFDENLRTGFETEMRLFLDSVLRSDTSVLDLLTADYTFVNGRLAQHYDIPNVSGARFRKVHLDDPRRWGLLGKGAVLMVSSYPHRTSPVRRGAWILDKLIGTPPSAPPPGVNVNALDKAGAEVITVRERLEQHGAEPSCNMCHGVIDPIGLALENFDAVGAWRDKDRDAGAVIDATGHLADGAPINGPVDLREALMKHKDDFMETLAEKTMAYGLGRQIDHNDMPQVRDIVRRAAKEGYRFAAIVKGVVESDSFQMKRVPDDDGAGTKEAALHLGAD
jgi:hypothetical protein